MSNTYADRITRLATKLDSIDAKIGEYQTQREIVVSEIQTIVSGSVAKTAIATKVQNLGEKVMNFLTQTDGQTNAAIATKLKVAPQKTSLSLYHLVKKGQVYLNGDKYFVNGTAMAKTATTVTD